MDTTKIKLISFDLWETLIFDSKNHNQRNQLRINNLRSLSQGRANYTMQFDHYEEVPSNVADEVKAKLA